MIKLDRPIIVEGKYDKIRLSALVDAVIVTTDGFAVLSDKDRLTMLRALCEKNGAVVLTDSDAAGFRIRGFLKGAIRSDKLVHAYIPDVFGKEARKRKPSSEGKVGVEGMDEIIISQALQRCGVVCGNTDKRPNRKISKPLLYELGLTGRTRSRQKRLKLCKLLQFPEYLSSNALADILGECFTEQELRDFMQRIGEE